LLPWCELVQGWNNITIELWTHEREGLSENDFIVAAKLDELLATPDVQQLLSKKQPEL
jgi:4a-hydroxytetrahydrobiopterin dehydratase